MEPLIREECLRNAAVRLRKFREEYGVWTAPVNTFRLLREIERHAVGTGSLLPRGS